MREKRKAEVAGRADGDGMTGMNRLYNYEAIKLVLEGVQRWILNYAKEARRLADFRDRARRRNGSTRRSPSVWSRIAHNKPRTSAKPCR